MNDPAVDPNAGATSILLDQIFHVVTHAIATVDVQISNLTAMRGSAPEVKALFNGDAIPIEYYLRLSGAGVAIGNAAGTHNSAAAISGDAKPVIDSGVPGQNYMLGLTNVVIKQYYAGDGGGF